MLVLQEITKDYTMGDTRVHALRGVSLAFREHEFVAILGPSSSCLPFRSRPVPVLAPRSWNGGMIFA